MGRRKEEATDPYAVYPEDVVPPPILPQGRLVNEGVLLERHNAFHVAVGRVVGQCPWCPVAGAWRPYRLTPEEERVELLTALLRRSESVTAKDAAEAVGETYAVTYGALNELVGQGIAARERIAGGRIIFRSAA